MIDMIEGLKKCGIPETIAEPLAQKMESYIKEIILFNSAYNLTNTSDRDELVVRHIFDSLVAWPKIASTVSDYLQNGSAEIAETPVTIADIGSGGGLPAFLSQRLFP